MSKGTQGAELGNEREDSRGRNDPWYLVCSHIMESAKEKHYSGYSKFDALNSPLLARLSLESKWLRLIFTQLVNRCPWHVRPILGVRISRNAKGIALFVRAALFLWAGTGERKYRAEAEKLLAWLIDHKAKGTRHSAWGYNFVWQNTIFLQQANDPNCVVTVFVGEAFLQAYQLLGKKEYLLEALDIARFVMNELPVLKEGEGEKAIGYVLRGNDSVVLNINALAGAFLAKVWKATGDDATLVFARELMAFTVRRRTLYNAWYYTHPKEKSPITHDNYHTGGILDALLEFMETTDDHAYQEIYWAGLEYYRTRLFEKNGAPRWMNDKKYPFDVHGAAQGIISFTKAARYQKKYVKEAEGVASWVMAHLYRESTKDFAYRQGRFMLWNYSLMRWCNAWMARALAEWCCFLTDRDKAETA